jgi:ferric-dicitrate binding protein FerR (iron transport regulator)
MCTSVGRRRVAISVVLVIGAALLGALVTWHAGQKSPKATAAAPPAPAQSQSCQSRLLSDWSDGRIDGVYPLSCYRAALQSLPADLEVYSSAHDDIAQALSERIVLSRHPQKISGHQGATTPRKIASAP